jgi:hypothetical protein
LILLGRPGFAALAAPPFDETWDVDAALFSPLFSDSAQAGPSLREKLGDVTSALLFASPASPLSMTLESLGVKQIVRQDPFPSSVIHVVDYHLSLFSPRDAEAQPIPQILIPELGPGAESSDVVAIHPGSGSAKKNWPLARYIQLAARLGERGERIAWIVGPAEQGLEPPPGADVWVLLPLPMLAARLAWCRLYVGNDSGVTHLAAATGCSTVALFGGSDPRVWAPRGARVNVIDSSSRGLRALSVRDVLPVCEDFLKEK